MRRSQESFVLFLKDECNHGQVEDIDKYVVIFFLCSPHMYAAQSQSIFDAIQKNDVAAVKKLVAEHADLNIRGKDNRTPLILAAREGKGEIVDILLKAGAAKDLQGRYGWTALMEAALDGHKDIVDKLIAAKADINKDDNTDNTALMCAAQEVGQDC